MMSIARIVVLALIFGGAAFAQGGPDLHGSFPDTGSAPVPHGPDGKPLAPHQMTPAEREDARTQEAQRLERIRADEERQAVESRHAEELRVAAERLAEEKKHNDSVMTAVWVGLGIAGVVVASRFFKRT